MRMSLLSWLPALFLIAGLTTWAVQDRPERPETAWTSDRAHRIREVVSALRRLKQDVELGYQSLYSRRFDEVRARHEAAGLQGDALEEAIRTDPGMDLVREFSQQQNLLSKGGNLWSTELETLASELETCGSDAAEAALWKERVGFWNDLVPYFVVGAFKWKEALEQAELPPTNAIEDLISASEALSGDGAVYPRPK